MKRRLLNLILILALALSAVSSVLAQDSQAPAAKNDARSYIVVMEQDPIIAYDGDIGGYAATKPAEGKKVNPNSAHVRKYEKFLEKNHNASLAAAGVDASAKVNEYTYALNGYSAILTEAEAKSIKLQPGVAMVLEDQMRYAQTDSAPTFLGLTAPGGAYLKGYTGEGVLVGVIDSGIWPEHPSFADDGSYPDAPVLDDSRPNCEFGNTAHNPDDAPFECNNKLVGARQMIDTYRLYLGAEDYEYDSARDDNGHGTHTASTAAGNADVAASIYGIPRGLISGIAPRAQIIAYKGLGDLGGFTSDLAAAIDWAVADGVDVINYSIGGGAGGPGADEIAFLFADAAGVFVATSAGNSGPGAATLGNPGTMPWVTTVGANTQSRFFKGTAVLGDGSIYTGASITGGTDELVLIDAADYGNELCDPADSFTGDVSGKIVLCRRGATARADKSRAVYLAGGAGMIMYNNTDTDNLATDSHWVPSVHIDQTPGLAIKAYIASDPAPTAMILGGEADVWPYAPSMTIFSSRGPNPVVPDIIKPDITAPGTQILAGYSPTPAAAYDIQGELFAAIQGTSMSSPIIAGVGALLSQAQPDWSPAMIRSAMMTTAYQDVVDNDRISPADPFDFGAGHVNAGGKWIKGSINEPGLVYDAGLFEYAAFTCGMDWGVFTPGSCVFLDGLGIPSEAYNLNYPSIGIADVPGTQTVVRTVTSVAHEKGWRHYTVSVEAPDGYEVTVSPSTLRLKQGQSATYAVTVTNVSAPIGEWRFGSLTWNNENGHYSAYSPIAVRAALFNAPAEVSASGTAGSTSFDVSFGYTGDYSVAAHGLTADAPTSDVIGQDPDQTYPSGDDGVNGGVVWIDFPITGAAFARWELVIPGDDDIDLFLENSAGTIIAASTSGGTDELIEIFLPADDTYTMAVHGWSVPNEPLPFTLHYWEVPLASVGSLNIDASPASATQGVVGTIDLSWSGLASGTSYLGAVSHNDASGLMGFTLVSVDTH